MGCKLKMSLIGKKEKHEKDSKKMKEKHQQDLKNGGENEVKKLESK